MFIKKLADPSVEQPPKSWLIQKWRALDLWWYVFRPDWVRTTERFYWHHIRPIFAPQNRWAVKPVRRTWQDKCGLIEDWLYAAVIDFVEGEKCFEQTNWEWNDDARRLGAELREVYTWAKTGRAEFQAKIDALYLGLGKDFNPNTFMSISEEEEPIWDEYNRLTAELEQWDDRCLTWVVANRGILWV